MRAGAGPAGPCLPVDHPPDRQHHPSHCANPGTPPPQEAPLAVPPLCFQPITSAGGAALVARGMPPSNIAQPPLLPAAAPGTELAFADERLGQQAAAWRRKQQALAAQLAALQQGGGPLTQPQQLQLILLQVRGRGAARHQAGLGGSAML